MAEGIQPARRALAPPHLVSGAQRFLDLAVRHPPGELVPALTVPTVELDRLLRSELAVVKVAVAAGRRSERFNDVARRFTARHSYG